MKKGWLPCGVSSAEPFTLSEKHKEKLLGVIGVKHDKAKDFLVAIEHAVASAKGVKKHRESVKPAAVRSNLKKTLKNIEKLTNTFAQLDSYSKSLVREIPGGSDVSEMVTTMVGYYSQISEAFEHADNLPKKGKLYQGHQRLLAYLVAEAIRDILQVEPTLTHDESLDEGPERTNIYAQCLSISLDAASFSHVIQKPSSLYCLMKEGMETLKTRTKNPGSVIELRKNSF